MSELLKRTDRLWSGEAGTSQPDFHPFGGPRMLEELAPGVAFFKAFVNVTSVKTDDGLVLVDTGSFHPLAHKRVLERASALLAAGDAQLAAHFADWAMDAEPASREVHAVRTAVYQKLLEASTSTMSKGIYGAAARESAERAQKAQA